MKRQLTFSLALIFAMLCEACSPPMIGSKADFDATKSSISNGSPVTLDIRDKDKSGTASGVGPARYTSITADHIQTMQSGTVPRDVYVEIKADGTIKTNLSSGSDITGKGVEYDPKAGTFKIAEFSTLTSDPLKAHNEAYDRLSAYWASRDQASKDAILAQIDALKSSAPGFFDVLKAALTAAGVP